MGSQLDRTRHLSATVVIALAASSRAQWLVLLLVAALWPEMPPKRSGPGIEPRRRRLAWAELCSVGRYIFRGAMAETPQISSSEPIHHDEVTCYAFTQGFASTVSRAARHPELPFGWFATSELTYYPTPTIARFSSTIHDSSAADSGHRIFDGHSGIVGVHGVAVV